MGRVFPVKNGHNKSAINIRQQVSSDFTAKLLAHAINEGPKTSVYRGLTRQEDAATGWSWMLKMESLVLKNRIEYNILPGKIT